MKKTSDSPKERGLYAITKHSRGCFLLFLNEEKDNILNFMQLPDRYKVALAKDEFTSGVVSGLLDFVEQIPEEVYEVAYANVETYQKSS